MTPQEEREALIRSLLRNARDEAALFDSMRARPARPVLAYTETPDHGREF